MSNRKMGRMGTLRERNTIDMKLKETITSKLTTEEKESIKEPEEKIDSNFQKGIDNAIEQLRRAGVKIPKPVLKDRQSWGKDS